MTRPSHRIPRTLKATRVTALAIATAVGLTGCVSGGGSPPSSSPSSPSSSSTQGSTQPKDAVLQSQWANVNSPLRVDLLSLGKTSKNTVALRLRLVNTGTDAIPVSPLFGPREGEGLQMSFGGMALVDGKNQRAYYPWQKFTDQSFIESGFPGTDSLAEGEKYTASVLYPPLPPNVSTVDVYAPGVLFHDVPVNANEAAQSNDPAFDKSDLYSPIILPLASMQEDLSGDKTVDDTGNRLAIRLSSDVLFKLNKANLTSKANAILKQVATQIDRAKATTISIDGYTDDSGNDAINNPLSKKRAVTVHDALQKLVTRKGITYQVAGHGSADPVASNKTAEGSQKNRRVTVSFNK